MNIGEKTSAFFLRRQTKTGGYVMKLIINSELKNKCGYGSSEYWFSFRDYAVTSIKNLACADKPNNIGQMEYFFSLGLIPFVSVSNEEIMRAFVKTKENKKLDEVFDKLDGDELVDGFWKYYNAFYEFRNGFEEFQSKYINERIARWCEENSIEYAFE